MKWAPLKGWKWPSDTPAKYFSEGKSAPDIGATNAILLTLVFAVMELEAQLDRLEQQIERLEQWP